MLPQPCTSKKATLSTNLNFGCRLTSRIAELQPNSLKPLLLTAFQFVISQVLLIAALVVIKQVDHFTTLPLGFNQNAVLIADVPEIKTSTLSTLKNQLPESPANKDATFSLNTPAAKINKWWAELKHQSFGDEQQGTEVKFVDSAYFRMVEIKLIAVTLNMWSYD